MAKQVIRSKLAQQDRKSILAFWINHTRSYTFSRRLNQMFENNAALISRHPKIGRETEIQDVKIKIIKDYYFTYRETESRIEKLTIWDSRQDPENFIRILK